MVFSPLVKPTKKVKRKSPQSQFFLWPSHVITSSCDALFPKANIVKDAAVKR